MTYRVSDRARRDLIEIWRYIANDNESAADRFIDLITQRFQLVGENIAIPRISCTLRWTRPRVRLSSWKAA